MGEQLTILVSASPNRSQVHLSAIKFVEQSIKNNILINSVFFYQDAVLLANKFRSPPSDESDLVEMWLSASSKANIELQTCVAASYRRGVIDKHQAEETSLSCDNLHRGFAMVGLGQFAASISNINCKLVHFK